MGQEWATVLQDDVRVLLSAVVEPLKRGRDYAITSLGLDSRYVSPDLENLLNAVGPDIVIDCSPPSEHAQNSVIALQHGCHVLGEKPMSLEVNMAKQIIEHTAKSDRIYMINQNYRWHPMFIALKLYLSSLPLGAITSIDLSYSQNFTFKDTFRQAMPHPLLFDMAIHHFDLIRALTRQNFKEVLCKEANPKKSKFASGAIATALLETENGILCTYHGSWCDISDNNSFVGSWRIACENGTLYWNGVDNPQLEKLNIDNKIERSVLELLEPDEFKPESIFVKELKSSLNQFLYSIETHEQPETWCGDNFFTLSAILSAAKSSETGSPVLINNEHIYRDQDFFSHE